MSQINLSVPARPDYVHVLRSVIASVAAKLSFSYDEIEDLRLAVDEACAYLMGVQPKATRLSVTIVDDDENGRLETLAIVDGGGNGVQPSTQHGVIWHILAALTDEARFENTVSGPGIRFSKGHLE